MVHCCSCTCNGVSARCIHCACVRSEQPCVSCLFGRAGRCRNGLDLIRDGSSTSISQCQKSSTSLQSGAKCIQDDARGLVLASYGLSPPVSSVSSQDSGVGPQSSPGSGLDLRFIPTGCPKASPIISGHPGFAHLQLSPITSCCCVCQGPHPSPCP